MNYILLYKWKQSHRLRHFDHKNRCIYYDLCYNIFNYKPEYQQEATLSGIRFIFVIVLERGILSTLAMVCVKKTYSRDTLHTNSCVLARRDIYENFLFLLHSRKIIELFSGFFSKMSKNTLYGRELNSML